MKGVGVVRRAFAKRDDHADYFHGMPTATRTGCQLIVTIYHQEEFRIALGGEHSGQKQRNFEVELACYIRSRTPHAEDAQDDVYALQDALLEHLRADRTLGSAVFQAGEHMTHGNAAIRIEYGQPESRAELTKSFMSVQFSACEIVPQA
ncbi:MULTISPECIES: hypothetical protein [Streptomycetaceae]|uniref:Uncharacterized protein n=1 Tax=Streptantibioticus cattleyicolor (strain ATCC 35852 / DSM 46488 / JCM 4925 / NBRC 14057 / NRRL 8057) TaxID=1003195 RepID=G8WRB8_STREN|nr:MULTISPECIES: hypothetical protein [Streptomycetaceae]AEW92934.1 hypothetical protein SCATT_05630 [Streptantibioticus cattleyicolor NRRL 8057 = DSM 46488]